MNEKKSFCCSNENVTDGNSFVHMPAPRWRNWGKFSISVNPGGTSEWVFVPCKANSPSDRMNEGADFKDYQSCFFQCSNLVSQLQGWISLTSQQAEWWVIESEEGRQNITNQEESNSNPQSFEGQCLHKLNARSIAHCARFEIESGGCTDLIIWLCSARVSEGSQNQQHWFSGQRRWGGKWRNNVKWSHHSSTGHDLKRKKHELGSSASAQPNEVL